MTETFQFTPDNLLNNLDKMGAWSAWSLAEIALQHYFPDEFDEDGNCDVLKEVELVKKLGGIYWTDVIVKYHKEIGYTPESLNSDNVNEF